MGLQQYIMSKLVRFLLVSGLAATVIGLLAVIGSYLYIAPRLPEIETLRDFRLQVPLRVFTQDNKLIAEFGKMKRTPIKFHQTPELMIHAILAAEDDRFFEHPGVDYHGILRAAVNLLKTGQKSQGGSTITMQVARNFFLSREKTYLRKLSEIFLSFKIEREISKEEILELYLNKIYLGNRAYGIAAAAQIYYGIDVNELTLPQMAMIAGLPKAPSRYNPIADPERATLRRNYVLSRMHQLGFIDDGHYAQALATQDDAQIHGLTIETEAPYVAEMVRDYMVEQYGEEAYTGGFSVTTTLDSRLQETANKALRKALFDYDMRHGYRGIIRHTDPTSLSELEPWQQVFDDIPTPAGLQPALVLSTSDQEAFVVNKDEQVILLEWDALSWARQYIDDNQVGPVLRSVDQVITAGDIIYLREQDSRWLLAQIPQAEGAIVSLRPENGSLLALSGGLDFYHSKYNRVTQATRQPGSSFKPFIYSAALNKGFTAASIVNDAPVVFDDPGLESVWRPENYSGQFFGPTRLRLALTKSRNLVSIRLLRAIGIDYTLDYINRFGIPTDKLPHDLSLALGSGAITPLQLASGYAVFANGGYRVIPHFIVQIEEMSGQILFQSNAPRVCPECLMAAAEAAEQAIIGESPASQAEQPSPSLTATSKMMKSAINETAVLPLAIDAIASQAPAIVPAEQVIEAENVYIMTSMMQDVIQLGTGRLARQLGRKDIAGKTGTTNDQRDAWFAGFNPNIVTVTWVGFDKSHSLGNFETGGKAALPMWIDFMRVALQNIPERPLFRPPGLVTVKIDPETGLLANTAQANAIFETFRPQYVPQLHADNTNDNQASGSSNGQSDFTEQLF